jgi:hypothetical protein
MATFDHPFAVFVAALLVQWGAAYAGDQFRRRVRPFRQGERADFDVLRTGGLSLLGLLIGFSFAMAVSRYDQRNTAEQAEANAISTAYLRAGLLPADDGSQLRELLRRHIANRIAFYEAWGRSGPDAAASQAGLKTEIWNIVTKAANAERTPIIALVVASANDVFASQGQAQAAWLNRIPAPAWALMGLIAICCNLLLGYGEHRTSALLLILPVLVSIPLFLIADIDNPHGGIIDIAPRNLMLQKAAMRP